MESDEQTNQRELADGVQLVELLLETADGGGDICFGEYEASTILAMFENSMYRNSVLAAHSSMPPTSTPKPDTK